MQKPSGGWVAIETRRYEIISHHREASMSRDRQFRDVISEALVLLKPGWHFTAGISETGVPSASLLRPYHDLYKMNFHAVSCRPPKWPGRPRL